MDLKREGRQLALALINVDDVVLAREVSGSGINLLSFAGRSVVGTAVAGAGMATRAAFFGAQFATKSALAVAGAAKGRVPGAAIAENVAYEIDKQVGRGGEAASFIASQGVALGKTDGKPPAEPIFGDAWLGKRLKPGATPRTVLVDSAIDLTRLAALPVTIGTATLASALSSPAGQQVTRTFWDSVSMIVDAMSSGVSGGATKSDRSERRAMLVMVGMTPLVTAVQDIVDLGEGLSRAAAGDDTRLRSVLATMLQRIDSTKTHTPAQLAVAYGTMVGGLVVRSLQSAFSGAFDVSAIEAWIRADEANRAAGGGGTADTCPTSLKQLESIVAVFSKADAESRAAGFYVPGTIELARDTIFGYSYRALGREAALARMARLFGADVRRRLRDDCSLWGEIIDARSDRDARLAALVSQLQHEGPARLRDARDHAAARLASLSATTPDRMFERLMPQRIGDRIAILQRFVGMADTANALDRDPAPDAARQRVLSQLQDWMSAPAPVGELTTA